MRAIKILTIVVMVFLLLAFCGPSDERAMREAACERQTNGLYHLDGQSRLSCLQRAR